jgi:putative ABC transport system permease protein
MAVGRARDGVSRPAVQAELESLHRQLVAAYPADNEGWTLQVDGLRDRMVRPVQSMLWIFQAAGLLVLVIACANVGGLLLVRGASREAEFAIRMALGAGRGRLSRQLLAEGLLISAAGTVLGIAVAAAGTQAFLEVAPASIPRLHDVAVDGAVAAFAAGLGAITTVVFGLVPLGRRFASRPAGVLRTHRTGPGMRLQSAFVIVQLALAVTLLFSAGLVLRAFARVSDWDPGFDRAGLVTAWALAPPDRFASPDAAVVALTRIREIAASVPGVLSGGLTSAGPLFGGSETGDLRVAERPESDGRPVNWYDVDEGYFQTLGLRPSSGRLITSRDTVGDPPVAVINDTLARQVFGDEDPIGRRVTVDDYASEVVGVVPTLLPVRPNRPPDPEIYWPIRQYKRYAAYLVLRIDGRTTGTEAALRRRLASDAPDVQVFAFQSIDAMFDRVLAGPRFNTWLIGVFALVALVLSGVGLFGTVAYSVSTRTREIGVRMALGATSRGVAARFVARTLRLAGAGAAIGLLLVVPLSHWLAGLLYGLSAADPAALAATLAVCVLISIVAGYLPARRAARVDPVIALRAE